MKINRARVSRLWKLRFLIAAAFLIAALVFLAEVRFSLAEARFYVAGSQRPSPSEHLLVKVVGTDYRWKYVYAGEDQRLGTSDDRIGSQNLITPAGRKVCLHLSSDDFVYLLEIPEVDVYELAAPGLGFDVQFASPGAGSYALLGSQMCGYEHSDLMGQMIVKSSRDFDQAMRELAFPGDKDSK